MQTYFAVDSDGVEACFNEKPFRNTKDGLNFWDLPKGKYNDTNNVILPKGSIKRLIGRELTWEDDFVVIDFSIKDVDSYERGI